MITNVKFISETGSALDINLLRPEISGYAITGITGIEPPEVDIKTTALVSGIRHIYNAGFTKLRLIDFSILYIEPNNQNLTIKELRSKLYSLLSGNSKVKVVFTTDEYISYGTTIVQKILAIEGYVSTNQGVTFNQACSESLRITCPDNYFKLCMSNGAIRTRYESCLDDDGYAFKASHTFFKDDKYQGGIATGYTLCIDNQLTAEELPGGLGLVVGFGTNDYPYTIIGPSIKFKIPNNVYDAHQLYLEVDHSTVKYYHYEINAKINHLGIVDIEALKEVPLIENRSDNVMLIVKTVSGTAGEAFDVIASYETLFMGV